MTDRYSLYNGPPIFQFAFDVRLMWCQRVPFPANQSAMPRRLFTDIMSFMFAERNSFWCVVNGGRLVLKPGDLLVLRGGDKIEWGSYPARPSIVLTLGLRMQQKGGDDFISRRAFERRYRLRNPRKYSGHFDAIVQALRLPMARRSAEVSSAILQWIVFVLKETGASYRQNLNLSAATVQRVLDAQAWAEAHLRETITLRDWARSTGWNPVYFGRMFKVETAYRPMKWLEERRMEMACDLLLGGDLSIAGVAEAVGYPDSFYFSQVFKKHFGKPPLQFRKSGALPETSR